MTEKGNQRSNRVVAVNSSPVPGALEFSEFYGVEIVEIQASADSLHWIYFQELSCEA